MLLAVAILPFIAQWVGISPDQLWLAMLYCTLLPTMGAATPSGVLRALDRFDLISWQSTATPISRVILVFIAYFMSAPFGAYVAAWYLTDLGGDLYHGSSPGASFAVAACWKVSDRPCVPRRFPARGASRSTSI